jgi:hypothetical protein
MKKTLILCAITIVSSLFFASNSFAGNTPKAKSCLAHLPGDPCTYTSKSGKTHEGTCMKKSTKMNNLICVKSKQ